jgi:phosphohistidine swiveling domain-containing protein
MEWYSFRKRKLPMIIPVLYYFEPYNKKNIGTDLFWFHIVEGEWHHELILKENYDKAGEFLFNQLLEDRKFIKKRLKNGGEIGNNFISFLRNKFRNLKNYTNEELLKLLDEFYDFYQKFSVVNMPPWIFLADKLSYHILERLSGFVKEDINKIFTILSTPNKSTYTKEEELDVLSLAIYIKENDIKDFKKTNEFKTLVSKYFWIPFDYLGPEIWDEKYYIKRINELLLFELDVLKKQKEEILQYQRSLELRQKRLIKELKLPEDLINLFEAMKDIAILQDQKKATTTESHYYLQNLFRELAERTGMDYSDFYFVLNEEIKEVLLNSRNMKDIVKNRKKLSVTIIKDEKIEIFTGSEAKDYAKNNDVLLPSQETEENVTVIKGITGSQGYAVGEVRIIDKQADMSKFKKGEILVATMTSPDYVPIMSKAKAIITNEGGITCHAAIVSRELGIPCIIGTEIATKVLKNGDIVEVNADNGIVKVIKRK